MTHISGTISPDTTVGSPDITVGSSSIVRSADITEGAGVITDISSVSLQEAVWVGSSSSSSVGGAGEEGKEEGRV